MTRLGITSVRFTGGEPLVAKNLEDVVAAAAALAPRPEIALTTNGIGLAARAAGLARAGLDRVNVSLNTLDRARFAATTRRDRLHDVLEGFGRRADCRSVPDQGQCGTGPADRAARRLELLRHCLQHGYQLRIIEQMPLDSDHRWRRDEVLTAHDVLAALRRHFRLTPDPAPRGSAPAELWTVDGSPDKVGIIASVTHTFCSDCDRTRLTADGQVRSCLFSRQESDLRGLLRGGADDDTVEAAWRAAMWAKPAGHGINGPGFVQPDRSMSAIGG